MIRETYGRFIAWLGGVSLVRFAGIVLILLSIPGFLSIYYESKLYSILPVLESLAPELVGIAVTILIIDKLNQRQSDRQEKQQLLEQLRSRDVVHVKNGVARLRAKGWLMDGTLCGLLLEKANFKQINLKSADFSRMILQEACFAQANLEKVCLEGVDLQRADLQGANLSEVKLLNGDLTGADLTRANLLGAQVDRAQLEQVNRLVYATMPDGKKYNGRYQLPGDLQTAKRAGFNINDPVAMARFYEVTLAAYQDTQPLHE